VGYSWSFLLVAIVLVLTPGADFTLIVRNSLSGGRRHGAATTLGVSSAAALQGLLVTAGVAGVIVRVRAGLRLREPGTPGEVAAVAGDLVGNTGGSMSTAI
jgi:threonine/homoserine/homoserine lactone efflux protein